MKFSVIIPLYNKAPYVQKALESVLAQTYTDYELIVVDDGSTDDSAKIAEEFIDSSFPSGRAGVGFFRQPNAGVSAARNNAVAQARGDYLAFLDADDWWKPTYLERMAQLITDYPDAGLYACNYYYHKDGTNIIKVDIPTGYINYPKAYCESNAMPVWTGTTIIPKSVFQELSGFPMGIKLGEDFLLWAKIAMQYPVAFLNEPLAYYNNDVPAALRLTRHLYKPEEHMLFHIELLGDEAMRRRCEEAKRLIGATIHHTPSKSDWSRLLDKLRVNGLLDYWMSHEYHEQAKNELAKVDWTQQPASVKRIYKTPIWILKLRRWVMKWGSVIKQWVMRR